MVLIVIPQISNLVCCVACNKHTMQYLLQKNQLNNSTINTTMSNECTKKLPWRSQTRASMLYIVSIHMLFSCQSKSNIFPSSSFRILKSNFSMHWNSTNKVFRVLHDERTSWTSTMSLLEFCCRTIIFPEELISLNDCMITQTPNQLDYYLTNQTAQIVNYGCVGYSYKLATAAACVSI